MVIVIDILESMKVKKPNFWHRNIISFRQLIMCMPSDNLRLNESDVIENSD